jgi:hypothetical protein
MSALRSVPQSHVYRIAGGLQCAGEGGNSIHFGMLLRLDKELGSKQSVVAALCLGAGIEKAWIATTEVGGGCKHFDATEITDRAFEYIKAHHWLS